MQRPLSSSLHAGRGDVNALFPSHCADKGAADGSWGVRRNRPGHVRRIIAIRYRNRFQAPHELEVEDEHFPAGPIDGTNECSSTPKSTPTSQPLPIDLLPAETVKADEEFEGGLRVVLTDYRVSLRQCLFFIAVQLRFIL